MLDQHPIIQWVAVATMAAAVGGGAFSIYGLHKQLDDVATMLRDIQDDQADSGRSSDARFQTRADEHRDIAQGVNWLRGALANNCTGSSE